MRKESCVPLLSLNVRGWERWMPRANRPDRVMVRSHLPIYENIRWDFLLGHTKSLASVRLEPDLHFTSDWPLIYIRAPDAAHKTSTRVVWPKTNESSWALVISETNRQKCCNDGFSIPSPLQRPPTPQSLITSICFSRCSSPRHNTWGLRQWPSLNCF